MSKPTPGPWHRHGLHVHARYGQPVKHYAVADALQHGGMVTAEEGEANARLIAAAPDLLQALKDCRHELGRFAGPLDDAANHAILDADAAIAKAEGQ